MSDLTAERLKSLFEFDGERGRFVRNVSRGCTKAGSDAGYVSGNGYRYLMVDKKLYLEHRLVWFFIHGRWPSQDIDHINGNQQDNRIGNLREASASQNAHNTGKPTANKSGYKGVSQYKQNGKWVAKCRVGGKLHHLGYFTDIQDAARAYQQFARKAHGNFFREVTA